MAINFIQIIGEMEEKVAALKVANEQYISEKAQLESRLAEIENLLSPLRTDIDGLEMAIESLKSTSLAQPESVEVIAQEPVAKESKESLQKLPAKKNRGGKNKPIHINVYDQYWMLKKRFGSIKEAKVGLRWGYSKVMDSLLMDKAVQLSRYGFYISRI